MSGKSWQVRQGVRIAKAHKPHNQKELPANSVWNVCAQRKVLDEQGKTDARHSDTHRKLRHEVKPSQER